MKILLSPLYSQSKICKHCARIFYRKNPGKWLGVFEFEDLPPLGNYTPGKGFQPDFPILSMFDEFVIDGSAVEKLMDTKSRPWLGTWPETISLLKAEGALSIIDMASETTAVGHKRGWMLRRDLKNVDRWLSSMSYHNSLMASFNKALGDNPSVTDPIDWEFNPEMALTARGHDGKTHDLASVLHISKTAGEEDPHMALQERALQELRSQLKEINASIAVSESLGIAPMMWAPYREYLKEKLGISNLGDDPLHAAESASLFFEISFPRYAPLDAKHLDRLRSDKRIKSLREEIMRAANQGDLIDPSYPQRILEEVLNIEFSKQKLRRITSWISTLVSEIPIPGLGIGAAIAGEVPPKLIKKSESKKLKWFYLISDGAGIS